MYANKDKLSFTLKDYHKEFIKDILHILSDYSDDLYLFGSFSKGNIKPSSDMDLLLIIPNKDFTVLESRKLKNAIWDLLLDLQIRYDREIDLKLYGSVNFDRAITRNYFEQSILKDLILLKDCL